MAYYDIIIRNGSVLDGSGRKAEKMDVAVSGEEIKKIGDLKNDNAIRIIDAEGKYVCPGFIDLTNHSDTHWTLFTDPLQESLVRQGVTTIVGGSCGSSIAPLVGKKGLKSIDKWVEVSKTNVNWQTMDELFYELGKNRMGINFASMVGLQTLYDSAEGEVDQMKFLLEKSFKEGAFGLSAHLGSVQMSSLSDDDLVELLKVVAKNKGVSKQHLEDEGKNILPAISRLIQLSRKSGARLHISHFKVLGRSSWPLFGDALKMMNSARKKAIFGGIELTLDFFPYERTGSDLFMLLPAWLRKMKRKEIAAILESQNSERRKEVVEYLKKLTLHYDKITVASSFYEQGNLGKTIAELSSSTELSPEELILNLLLINDLHVSMFSEVVSMDNIKELEKEEYSAIASDGVGYDNSNLKSQISNPKRDLPHPRSFGAFPKAIRMFAAQKDKPAWEETIRKMTGLPAAILGIKNRGIIAKGNKADIVVFNPEEISDMATYRNPFQFSKGVEYVIVNGQLVLSGEELAEKFAGQVIKKE